jgi:hypothetical protein
MSTRAMGLRYSAGGGGGGGGGGLLQYLTGNDPKHLQQGQFAHDDAVNKLIIQHEKDMKKLEDELKDNDVIRQHAAKLGISPKDFVGAISEQFKTNALTDAKRQGELLVDPDVQAAQKEGLKGQYLTPAVANAKALEQKAEKDTISTRPSVKGIDDTLVPNTVRGPQSNPVTSMVTKQIPGMKGQPPMPVEFAPAGGGTSGGSVSINPDLLKRLRPPSLGQDEPADPNDTGELLPPPSPLTQRQVSPIPADQQPKPNQPPQNTILSTLMEALKRQNNLVPPQAPSLFPNRFGGY